MKAPAPLLAAAAGSPIGLTAVAPSALDALPARRRQPLLTLATAPAGAKLAEMESRAHVVHELRTPNGRRAT